MIQQTNGSLPETSDGGVVLPETGSRRWQPIRGALLNLYRYDYEEFRYEEGRLLLRGNNGTGKSRVLALQLPFLLDGEIASHRLEPDGDPAKRMEWNLLLGKYPDRLGYTWIEFGRRDDEGKGHYLTLGCGLNAVEGRGIHSRWFFITDQRIGRDLFLATASGQPLVKNRLESAIEGHGEVFSSAEAYRRAVDRALFKLGDRYEALVELLIRLRQPKLSRTLDEKQLSDALSEALPPISPNVLADVAEAFGTLETDRRQLEDFKTARDGVEAFLAEYRVYVQIAARRRAERVRRAHSEYENTQRRLRKAETNQEQATEELRLVEARIAQLKEDERAAGEAVQTLASSPQMRDAEALDDSRRQAIEREREVQRASQEHQDAIDARIQLDSEVNSAKEAADSAWKNTDRVLRQSRADAESTGLLANHQAAIDRLGLPELASAKAIDTSENAIKALVRKHQAAILHVRQANELVQTARQNLTAAKETYARLESQLTEATERQRGVQLASEKASDLLLSEYRDWLSTLRELRPVDAETIADQIATWCELGHGEGPIVLAVRPAVAAANQSLAELNADAQFRLSSNFEKLSELESEYKKVEAGYHQPPPAPHTRDSELRATRPGAPLWALCEFGPEVQATQQAAIEAALESSGLLDAWVTPDGQLLKLGDHDTVLVSDTSPLPPEGRHLGLALIPCTDDGDECAESLHPSAISSVLRHIGLGKDSGAVCVELNGRWQLGPLHGNWSKPFAQHIGRTAREAQRQRRLLELAQAIDEASAIRTAMQRELETLAERASTVAREEATVPSDETIRRLQTEFGMAAEAVAAARACLTEAESRVEKCRAGLMDSTDKRDRDARDLNLVAWVDKLSELDEWVASYRETTAELWPTLRSYLTVRSQSQAAANRLRTAQANEQHRLALLGESRERAAAAADRRDALESTKGADAAIVLAELEAARSRLRHAQDQRDEAIDKRVEASKRLGGAGQEIDLLKETLDNNSIDREQAVGVLKSFAEVRLLATAHQELGQIEIDEWTVTRAVEIARKIEAALSDVESDDVAWDRNQKEIHRYIEELKDTLLPHGHSPVTTNTGEGLFVVTVPFHGREHGMDEFRDALSGEIEHHQLVLDAHEREVLENHLVGEVAIHLHELLHNADKLVRDMNDELTSRPTSTGMKLRFTWDPIDDGPPGLLEARRRLLGTGGTWSPSERVALGAFLQERIKQIRAANQTGTWYEHLAEALDYRKWHQFGVDRQQDGHWKRLNRKTYGTGSGGEKAIALTIPQFAAAAAHYRSADKLAPRLILLDEAFVGVDSDMRSKCMGLLHAFDLDFMMTSEREWGCYPTVPALAIYQLATLPGVDAVGITRWVWNGRERLRRAVSSWPLCTGDANSSRTFQWEQRNSELIPSMIDTDLLRLQQTLATQDLSWLLERMRQRLANGQSLRGVVTLRRATSEQRDAVDRLLGRPPSRGTSLSVELEQLEATLRAAELCGDLTDAVEALIGQVPNIRELRAHGASQWRRLFEEEHRQYAIGSSHHDWLSGLKDSGLLRRLSGNNIDIARGFLLQSRDVLAVLPCRGMPLAELAATTLGNSHALDKGSPVGTLIYHAIARNTAGDASVRKKRREAWASVGVTLDVLSSPVLTLNLTADSETHTGRSLNLHASVAEPCRLSTRQLLRHPPYFDSAKIGPFVYVCENPTVVLAAANRLGMQCAPLVCIEGQPKTAATILLRKLVAAGVQLMYHGDFDWSGIQIANLIIERHGAKPWKFGADEYAQISTGTKLDGTPVVAGWDHRLMPAMLAANRAVHEEQVIPSLIDDLATTCATPI